MTVSDVTPDWAVEHFNPWDSRITYRNIWPIYKAMRDSAPALYSDAYGGFWSITRYGDVREAARNYRVFSSAGGTTIGKRNDPSNKQAAPPKAPIEFDPPDHTRFRKALQVPFLPRRMPEFISDIRESVNQLLDKIALQGEFDIVNDLAEHVPQEVVSKILGFDEETRAKNRAMVLRVVTADFATRDQAWIDFQSFLREEIRKRQANPSDDFMSHLCNDEFDGTKFSEPELVGMLGALALAGHHTSINAISSLLRRMCNEKIRSAYLQDKSISAKIIEETLRIDPPVHLEARTTTEKIDLGGVTIPANASVALIYASANHDERQFEDPENFNIDRSANQHLAFGHGIHSCFGMHLARLEMSIVLEETLSRFPKYQLVGEPKDSGMTYGHHMGWESIIASVE